MRRFQTLADAEAAGYRRPRTADGDTQHVHIPPGPGMQAGIPQGWTSADGRESVTVEIRELRNAHGEPGALVDMIPPEEVDR